MASPGELVKATAAALGVPEASVIVHDRNLAIAGIRSKGGRGRSAAKMTSLDAANLLIGVAASSAVKETVSTVQEYGNLPSRNGEVLTQNAHQDSPTWCLPGCPVPSLQALPKDHLFIDALTSLIEAASDGTLLNAIENLHRSEMKRFPKVFEIEVTLWGPVPAARITIRFPGLTAGFTENHHYSTLPTDFTDIQNWENEMSEKGVSGDLKQIRQFSHRTIFELGEVLKR